jgi:hypothetical protein
MGMALFFEATTLQLLFALYVLEDECTQVVTWE